MHGVARNTCARGFALRHVDAHTATDVLLQDEATNALALLVRRKLFPQHAHDLPGNLASLGASTSS